MHRKISYSDPYAPSNPVGYYCPQDWGTSRRLICIARSDRAAWYSHTLEGLRELVRQGRGVDAMQTVIGGRDPQIGKLFFQPEIQGLPVWDYLAAE